jgi:hypothetical protein
MMALPAMSTKLVGRQTELQQISQILAADQDLLLAGVPGIGRRTLILAAAQACEARVVEIDCLLATNYQRFLQLLAAGLLAAFEAPAERLQMQRWCLDQPLVLPAADPSQFEWQLSPGKEWDVFQALLSLPQCLAEWLDCRVVTVFHNFPHLRSWDRGSKWERYLRQEIKAQSRVSYAFIATAAERLAEPSDLQRVSLFPLPDRDLGAWLLPAMTAQGCQFAPDTAALALFLSYVQGHFGDAIALLRRLGQSSVKSSVTSIDASQVRHSALALVEDLSLTFESLILLLPPSQVRVLESLALDPTDRPHAREYIRKHQLSRGGSLQGALASLEQKGLLYGPEYDYRIALPLLALWLKERLGE